MIAEKQFTIIISKKQKLEKEVRYLTDQLFWSEKKVERLLKENNDLLNQTIVLKKEIDQHLKVISELHDRYDDVRGR